MPKFARFAALFLSAAVALGAHAADLRPIKDPAQIRSVFPAAAKLRVLNVWATWCVPCVAEMPDLRVIDETFGSEVAITGVSLDDMIPGTEREKVVAFLDKQKIAFTNIYYTGNADDLGELLDFDGEIPITIVYDARGKEVWRHRGRLNREETIAQLRDLLRRK
ncbi:MAG TPA: TlpA disulfide reductase family protein [Thermoanaerobaculia bacterium]|nr:TlpA disulfide reductase family protein [Thermoanaerobaculia bacterium]